MQHSAADWLITRPTLHKTNRRDKSALVLFTYVYQPMCYVIMFLCFVTSMLTHNHNTIQVKYADSS